MIIKRKDAECGGTLAPYENVLAGQRDANSSSAISASFILPIDDRYRLTADEYAWRIERRKGKSWRAIEWRSDIETVVHSLAQRMIRTSEVQTPSRCALAAVESISRTLRDVLGPHFKVEVRS
jgi:hypothetical protein